MESSRSYSTDVLVIGAGPTGLACAIDAQQAGYRVMVVDKGCLCNSLFHYPSHMTFFTTSELLEIGNIPFPSPHAKPNRNEALEYYRKVAMHYRLDVRQYQTVLSVDGEDGDFRILTSDRYGRERTYTARKLILSTGYYDLPNNLNVPGEELPKVMHYYTDPHPYYDQDVLVIGGKNSAAIAALELWRHGARVTLVHRGPEMHRHVKYWIKPDIENRIKNGEVQGLFSTRVVEIGLDTVTLETPDGLKIVPNDFVFAMTGYKPDFRFLESLGVRIEGPDRMPVFDPESLESNVAGIYLAGVIVAGARTNEIFIENGRFHGRQIASDLAIKLGAQPQSVAEVRPGR
ncbi:MULTISPECIES: YpdA family putative bacillithiol disulfide reductase [Acidobacterium]|uniref:Pyridine nucleotide-disulfide oxidoreductase family n=1 Tax=Acidobacterium capsulatum (strain ATCC 51196 / DSM 11244 / BCRC 80197 / JCM 7670 / NBRC 15755 / NCIMB 13165 / 161) TaxID=240015 RepID=C1F6I5_ACIC5|nr:MULTISPECIES: YpdA family putative bacillithiol disulfide reductase [Acidobacterium]ACO34561.1 pyridine nucleotide-disulfide oxidoreductase family [Acidobacterium capsulatum ATCC 51196]HCT60874.1 YpdA family putative bacillithiol disulfide reductase [Acidobacterium sp.]